MSNPRKTTVESKGSKEFHPDKDVLTVEVVHAARILEEFFAKQGYDEWILMGVCSRKLVEKVQQRMVGLGNPPSSPGDTDWARHLRSLENPAYRIVGPSTAQERIRAEAGLNIEAGTYDGQLSHFTQRQARIDRGYDQAELTQNTAGEVHAQAVLRAVAQRQEAQEPEQTPF